MATTESGSGFQVIESAADEAAPSVGSFVVEEIDAAEFAPSSVADSVTTDTIDPTQEPPKRRGRRAGTRNAPKITDLTESLGLAQLALGNVNALAVTLIGDQAAMTDAEKSLLYPPIARSIRRLSPEAATKASVFVDPLAIVLGIGFWMRRVLRDTAAARAAENRRTATDFARASGIDWNTQPATDGRRVETAQNGHRTEPATTENGSLTGIPEAIIRNVGTDITGE